MNEIRSSRMHCRGQRTKLKRKKSLRFVYQQRKRLGHIPRYSTRRILNPVWQRGLLRSLPLHLLRGELNIHTLSGKLPNLFLRAYAYLIGGFFLANRDLPILIGCSAFKWGSNARHDESRATWNRSAKRKSFGSASRNPRA